LETFHPASRSSHIEVSRPLMLGRKHRLACNNPRAAEPQRQKRPLNIAAHLRVLMKRSASKADIQESSGNIRSFRFGLVVQQHDEDDQRDWNSQ
jgi:hypothetical protein